MNTFEDYSHEQFALTFDEMQQIHAELLEEIRNDGDAVELYDDVVDAATRYAAIRAEWLRISVNKKAEIDSRRTSFHNSTSLLLLRKYRQDTTCRLHITYTAPPFTGDYRESIHPDFLILMYQQFYYDCEYLFG